jgi:hypothetical protein
VTPNFLDKAATHSVWVPSTGKKLPFSCWMQKKPAPLVYFIPGLGSYRLDQSVAAYADMLYRNGYSVIAFSNPFQKEFMQRASTLAVPGYGPADCDDVVSVLKLIRDNMRKRYGKKITGNHLSGVSHGGYLTLMIAAREAAGQLEGLAFDRYVSVNPPVNLASALGRLDDMFNAPLTWPKAERLERMQNAIFKALYYVEYGLDISGDIPLTREESQFLIGLVFRYILMSTIIDSQRRQDLGVLENDPGKFVKQEAYDEIEHISYTDYMNRFVLPYLIRSSRGTNAGTLLDQTDLRTQTKWLSNNTKIRVQISEDDFLLSPADVTWFHSTFRSNLVSYPVGGHLGNLHVPAVQQRALKLFSEIAQ